MAHKKDTQVKKIKFQTPQIIKIVVWTMIVVIVIGAITTWYFLTPSISKPNKLTSARAEKTEKIIIIPLLGEKLLSIKIINIDDYPSGWFYRFEGPAEAKVHYSDGSRGFITENFGVKGGKIRFSGPVGQQVVVRFIPN